MRARVLLAFLLVACDAPTAPPSARLCRLEAVRTPLVIGGVIYHEILLVPTRCAPVAP